MGKEPSAIGLKVIHQDLNNLDPADSVFQKDHLVYGEILPFPVFQFVEFKQFSAKTVQEHVKNIIPEYVSAFANTGGGYLSIGVQDNLAISIGIKKIHLPFRTNI